MFVYFDIGGTKTRVSVSHDQESFAEPVSFHTPEKMEDLFQTIREHARALGGDEPIVAAGGGIASSFDRSKQELCWGPNLPQEWFDQPFVSKLSDALGCPVFMDNDTAVIGMGEAAHGAGTGYEVMVYMTISTGVGGARIVNGMSESTGRSSEPGWQYIDYDNTGCDNCESGSAQLLLSGASMEKRFGVKPYEVTDPAVWEQYAQWAGYMLANSAVHWTPNAFVLGGSMITGDPAIPIDRIEHHMKHVLVNAGVPDIRMAGLGDFGGIYGAMEFVRHRMAQQSHS
jgi:glucokinase